MAFLILLAFISLFIMSFDFFFVLSISFYMLFYIISNSLHFNQSVFYSGFIDEISFFMIVMTVFVMFTSWLYASATSSPHKVTTVFMFMFLFCVGVFTTNNLFYLYFFYECSLLPILYIIVKWGSYPERSLSAMILLVYTSIFTFPFIAVLFSYFYLNSTFLITPPVLCVFGPIEVLPSLIIFFTFAVNLPIYGLHFWLPMAHVEAPTFGSMILAGVLLNLGGVGLLRCSLLIDLQYLQSLFLSYLILFMIYVTVVCLFQSDFKRLVAYSSVSHMIAIPILLLSNNLMSIKSIVMLILFHGLSSPMLFMLVGILYSIFSSRQLILIRGVMLLSPLLSFYIVLAFFFTLSAPPFPSFVSEVYFLVSSLQMSTYFVYIFCIFTFLSLVYNLNWLSAMVFSSASTTNMSVSLSYLSFIPLFISIFFSVSLILLLSIL